MVDKGWRYSLVFGFWCIVLQAPGTIRSLEQELSRIYVRLKLRRLVCHDVDLSRSLVYAGATQSV